MTQEAITAELKRKASLNMSPDKVSPENRTQYGEIVKSNARQTVVNDLVSNFKTKDFDQDAYAKKAHLSQKSAINKGYNTAVRNEQNVLNDTLSNTETERAMAEQAYLNQKKEVNTNTYNDLERAKVMGASRGMTHSMQQQAMDAGATRAGNKLHNENLSDRDFKLSEIQRRITTLKMNSQNNMNTLSANRDEALIGAKSNAELRAEDLQFKYDDREIGTKQWAMSQALAKESQKDSQDFSTSERVAGQEFNLQRDEIQNAFSEKMTKLGFAHTEAMTRLSSALSLSNQKAMLSLNEASQMRIMNAKNIKEEADLAEAISEEQMKGYNALQKVIIENKMAGEGMFYISSEDLKNPKLRKQNLAKINNMKEYVKIDLPFIPESRLDELFYGGQLPNEQEAKAGFWESLVKAVNKNTYKNISALNSIPGINKSIDSNWGSYR